MIVPMMNIGEMPVSVGGSFVPMQVRVRLPSGGTRRVLVLVVKIMHVGMGVLQFFMRMFMRMKFGEMKPHTCGHK